MYEPIRSARRYTILRLVAALGNAPTAPPLSGDGASILIYTLVIAVLIGAPLLRAHRERIRLRLAV